MTSLEMSRVASLRSERHSRDMNQEELHPIDDTSEPGAYNTFGLLHHQLENYVEKRDAVKAAEIAAKVAEQQLLSARLEFTWAKRNLTDAINKAHEVTNEAELEKERILEAPLPYLPPGAQFESIADVTPAPNEDDDTHASLSF